VDHDQRVRAGARRVAVVRLLLPPDSCFLQPVGFLIAFTIAIICPGIGIAIAIVVVAIGIAIAIVVVAIGIGIAIAIAIAIAITIAIAIAIGGGSVEAGAEDRAV
jgi:hypothetical protein